MEVIPPRQLESASISPEPSRIPLYSQVNSPVRTPTLAPCKRIRRKTSLICHLDSSEEIPSSHESIFHAECLSTTNSEDNGSGQWPQVAISPTSQPATALPIVGNNENLREQLLSPIVGITPILYGHGTALTTIVEQKSTTTMNTRVSSAGPRSVSQLSLAVTSTPKLLDHHNSFELPITVTLHPPRRRKSFSADDVVFVKRSYHEACTMIERKTGVRDIYAKPHTPVIPPIERPSTPPGMPSWTEAQNAPVQNVTQARGCAVRGTQNRLQRFLGIRPSPTEISSRIPIPAVLQNLIPRQQAFRGRRSASSPVPLRVAPVFRPTRSGHGVGPLEMHPYLRADRADAKSAPQIPQTQAPNNPLSSQTGVTGHRMRRHTVHEDAPAPCPHRRGRLASLQSLRRHSELNVRKSVPWGFNPPLPASNGSQSGYTERIARPDPGVVPQGGSLDPATEAHAVGPIMSGAMGSSDPIVASAVKNKPDHCRCWKCRVSTSVSKLDDIWEASTSWCCWVFCGVDLYDERENDYVLEGGSGNGQGTLGPRRVILDGLPVVLY